MEPNKIVLHYADGRVIKGYTRNFSHLQPRFHISQMHPKFSTQLQEVLVKDLKAIFFVRDYLGNRKYKEQKKFPDRLKIFGRKVEVTFKDGEVMIGSTLGYEAQRPGFFIFPSDPHCNNLRIFVVSQAVLTVRYI